MRLDTLINEVSDQLDLAHQAGRIAFGHGTLNAFDEAAWLTLWALQLPLDTSDWLTIEVSEAQVSAVRSQVEQRIQTQKPLAYLTREAWLQGVPFFADERTLIPRSFIAELIADGSVDAVLSAAGIGDSSIPVSPEDTDMESESAGMQCKAQTTAIPSGIARICNAAVRTTDQSQVGIFRWNGYMPLRCLDMCTGGGSLAILLAMAYPEAKIDAVDVDADALEVARMNIKRHDLESRVELIQSDLWESLKGRRYDLVICNPPYVPQTSMEVLPAEYRAEPQLALAGGQDGMDVIRPFLKGLPAHLNANAAVILEIGQERAHFEAAFPDLKVDWLETSVPDQVLWVSRACLVKEP